MSDFENVKTKPKIVYVNFFSQPMIKGLNQKLEKYHPFLDFLFLLTKEFNIYVLDHIGVNGSFLKKGVSFQYFKKKNNKKLTVPWKVFRALKKIKPEVVYVQGLSYPHLIILMKWFLGSSTRVLVHDHANSIPKGWKVRIYKWADSYIDTYFFTSKLMAKPWIDKRIISSQKKIIECVEGSTQFTYNPTMHKIENSFLWVGRLDKNKDPLTILKAFSEFVETNSEAMLSMFYEDTTLLKEVVQFIEEKKIQRNIQLNGAVLNEELEIWFQRSKYFILGSYKEGGPLSFIEAMACGCVPIVTNIPAFKMMTDDGDCGFLFQPGNSKQLFEIFNKLNDSDIEKIRKKVLIKFDKDLSHLAIRQRIIDFVYSAD